MKTFKQFRQEKQNKKEIPVAFCGIRRDQDASEEMPVAFASVQDSDKKVGVETKRLQESPAPVQHFNHSSIEAFSKSIEDMHDFATHISGDMYELASPPDSKIVYHRGKEGVRSVSSFKGDELPGVGKVYTHKFTFKGAGTPSEIHANMEHVVKDRPVVSDSAQTKGGLNVWRELHKLHKGRVGVAVSDDQGMHKVHPIKNVDDHFGEDHGNRKYIFKHH